MPHDEPTPAHASDPSVDTTWDGTFPDRSVEQMPAERSRSRFRRSSLLVIAVLIAASVGFVGGVSVRSGDTQGRATVVEPGTRSGFDTRHPGRSAAGNEVPFINIRYYAFDTKATTTGFDGRCMQDLFLFVVGRFTPCNWALSVLDEFRGYDKNTYLGYEPSFVLEGVETYCHYHSSGLLFRGTDRAPGVPVWECRADGGRQLVFAGLTMSMVPAEECWAPDGTLHADMSIFAGSPADKERPESKPEWPTTISDCAP